MSKYDDPVLAAILEAKITMLLSFPFFAQLALQLKMVDVTAEGWLPTAATDGRHFYYNREFIKKLTKDELIFLVTHEVMHAVYDHIGRRGTRDPKIWNMAIDYIVNYTIVKNNVGKMIKGGLFSERYTDEMSSDQVYDLLMKNTVQIEMPLDMHLEACPNGGGDGDGDGDNDGEGRKVKVNVTGTNGPPTITEKDLEDLKGQMLSAVLNAAQSVGAGKVPAGIARRIKDLVEPVIDWREMVELHIKSLIKDDFTMKKFSRRSWGCGCILPGQADTETLELTIYLDMSGSISEDMARDFLSQIYGIVEQFTDFKITVACFDTKVYNFQEFTRANSDEILEYKPMGGGGTSFECVFDDMKERDIIPHTMVMFTDGYPNNTWGDEDYCECLFIIKGGDNIIPPFGSYAHYNEDGVKDKGKGR